MNGYSTSPVSMITDYATVRLFQNLQLFHLSLTDYLIDSIYCYNCGYSYCTGRSINVPNFIQISVGQV